MLDPTPRPDDAAFAAPTWAPDRWTDIRRDYSHHDVTRLAGSLAVSHTLAEVGARKLWALLHSEDFVPTLGTYTGIRQCSRLRRG